VTANLETGRTALIEHARRTGAPIGRAKAEEWAKAIPLNTWELDPVFQSPKLTWALEHWQRLAEDGTCPRHTDLFLPDLAEAVENAFMVELMAESTREGRDDYRCIYMGKELVELVGVDNTGQLVSECMPPLFVEQYIAINRLVRCWRRPIRGHGTFEAWQGMNNIRFESLVMPWSEDGEVVTRLFTCLEFSAAGTRENRG